MQRDPYDDDDACIVGIGCVLPDADNPQEFWDNILEGTCSIRKIPGDRWKGGRYLDADRKAEDKTCSDLAGFVENDRIRRIRAGLGLGPLEGNRLQVMALAAAGQAFDCVHADTRERAGKKAGIFLGCMEADESFVGERLYLHNEKTLREHAVGNGIKDPERVMAGIGKHFGGLRYDADAMTGSVLTTSVIDLMRRKLGIGGEGALIDAACASSLAALDVAVMALKNRKADVVVTGGMESNLSPDTFVLFSKVGALSPEKCRPFDAASGGLSQGEGAAVFVLQRLEDALRDGNEIYGVIRSGGQSSDGRSSSLFSPSVKGQVLALERAYEGLDKGGVDYIECHGTGTKLGDATELKSLNSFFGSGRIPVGSVKALIGHTKGAAGACGLLKCVLSMRYGKIPPSRYLETFIGGKKDVAYVNGEIIDLPTDGGSPRFGISSFGFGNANYHVVLDGFDGNSGIRKSKRGAPTDRIVVLSRGTSKGKDIDPVPMASKFRVPAPGLAHADIVQLRALAAVSDAFENSAIDVGSLDRERVSVISAGVLGLDAATYLAERVRHAEFADALDFLDEDSIRVMMRHKDRFPDITEDTGPGVLNNVIAGRICNVFDFNGENFNVDCDFNSFPVALDIAVGKLRGREQIVIVVYCEESLLGDRSGIGRGDVHCLVLSTLGLAKRNNYPIRETVGKVRHYESD